MIKTFTSKDGIWINASQDKVPYKFVPAVDRKKEILSAKLLKAALAIEKQLAEFYAQLNEAFTEVADMLKDEYEIKYNKKKKTKGSLTWYNFDRSIKIEADVNEIVKWDGALMTEAKKQLDDYITSSMSETNELISGLVTSAFSSSKGMIDTGKVFQILKSQDKIKNQKFQKACELIKKAQSIDRTKLYMRVWAKEADGQYRNINLNFSTL